MKLTGKISVALLLVVYIAAFMGFRLHECAVDHTVEVLGVLANDVCEQVHHHHCEDEAHCTHHHHHCIEEHESTSGEHGMQISEADCCSNSLHWLSEAQLVPGGGDDIAVKCAPAPLMQAALCEAQPVVTYVQPDYCIAGRAAAGRTALALYSVRRV
ncbi:MAG: hypothetical protein J6X89_07865 [Bacteroidales bacterium]|nr:hypothetical protein [Bacteroidales bacterium]